jgi:hypothetical protein
MPDDFRRQGESTDTQSFNQTISLTLEKNNEIDTMEFAITSLNP